jgi:hypothetical protein
MKTERQKSRLVSILSKTIGRYLTVLVVTSLGGIKTAEAANNCYVCDIYNKGGGQYLEYCRFIPLENWRERLFGYPGCSVNRYGECITYGDHCS